MPWSIKKKGDEYCVVKDDTGESEGCHPSRGEANDQLKALYASENKEKGMYYGTYGATSFAEYDQVQAALEERERMHHLHMAFMGIMDNILYDEEVTNKSGAIRSAADEMCSRMDSISAGDPETKESGVISFLVSSVKSLLKRQDSPQQEPTMVGNNMMFYKGKDGGLKWVARYSNNFRDDDEPAEIIASKSHAKFAALVKENIVKPPSLWLWHQPEWKWGEGQWAVYDDTGFALAGGDVFPGFEPLAEALAAHDKEIGVSHGMPAWSIERDANDPSVITGHITEEVSPLPRWAAANKMTSFAITKEASNMAISKADKTRLMNQYDISAEQLDKLERFNALEAQAAKDLRESKDVTTPQDPPAEAVVEATVETEVTVEVTEEPETPAAQPEPATTPQAEADPEVKELLAQLVKGVLTLSERQVALQNEVKSLKEADERKVAKQAANSPLASLAASLASVIGDDATRVDGRTSLAKSGPQESQEEVPQLTPIPFINQMIANGNRGGS